MQVSLWTFISVAAKRLDCVNTYNAIHK